MLYHSIIHSLSSWVYLYPLCSSYVLCIPLCSTSVIKCIEVNLWTTSKFYIQNLHVRKYVGPKPSSLCTVQRETFKGEYFREFRCFVAISESFFREIQYIWSSASAPCMCHARLVYAAVRSLLPCLCSSTSRKIQFFQSLMDHCHQ